MSSTRIGKEDELHLYINHNRKSGIFTINIELIESIKVGDPSYIPTDIDSFINLFIGLAKDVGCKIEAKNLTYKIEQRLIKKYKDL